ncbi:hypothetical protein DAPPUDRAFT_305658 [Daphnia pulex]|uniref:Uncharacterized protein n=1 Tax=Daphnia pulex TaxID=6669 RepID=E9FX65_DAPPU|nr:hypothetical protein DAPPUDRAFT_305658 [Daphnia pulex]|eukprot:EFX88023.1 hypothetical protein DAPPUDRAFT_305658 [Daphnia pulex]
MMEFPGRIYLRAEDDIHSAEHQTKLNKWILEFQRLSRESFVFPERGIRSFGYMFFAIGLILMIIQITLSSIQNVYIPSLLGSGIWIGLLSVATGVVGIYAAQQKSTRNLLDFMVMTTVLNIFSAMVVILNTIGLEMYSRFCASGRAKEWIGECGEATVILQSILVFLNVLLFLLTACCGGFVGRTLDMSFQLRTPPLVVYYSQNPIEQIIQTEEQQASKSSETSSENKTYRGDIASE